MRISFKPFPGLTLFTVISLAILIGLGTWQYHRLQWKTALLAEVELAATAPPLASLAEIETALEHGEPVDFRRVGFKAEGIAGVTPFVVYSREKEQLSWRRYLPIQQDGRAAFVAAGLIADAERSSLASTTAGPLVVAGYVRLWRKPGRLTPKSTPAANRWFAFNPLPETQSWAEAVPGGADMRFYIDSVPGALEAANLKPRRPEIRNNHFDYMLTWYGLALALFVIYLILHAQRGRLGFKD